MGNISEALTAFFEAGGDVLYVIFAATLLMWTLLIERLWFYTKIYPPIADRVIGEWMARTDRVSWHAHQIRRLLISQMRADLQRFLGPIRTLVVICPLLGLLGTTTGMIEVYDVLAVVRTGDPRALAGGVSKAMLTTMAGLIAALSGYILIARLEHWARNEVRHLERELIVGHEPR